MSLKHGILGFLNYGSMTGYDLSKAFLESVDFFWHAQTSQIYRELNSLEKDGLIAYETIIQHNKPNKKEYSITKKGTEEFLKWLSEEPQNELSRFKNEFLIKIFFSDSLTVEENIKKLEKFKNDCINYAEALINTSQSIDFYQRKVNNPLASLYWSLTADFGKSYILMCIQWAENSITKLKEEAL